MHLQVGTLKAVGNTPRQIVLVLLVEHLADAAGAIAIGLGIGRLLAPRIAATSTVLGRPEPPPLTWTRLGDRRRGRVQRELPGATTRPALRGIRQSIAWSLAARLAAHEVAWPAGPLAAYLGPRCWASWAYGRRGGAPGRLLTNAAGLLLGVAMIVVALALRDSLGLLSLKLSEPGHAATPPSPSSTTRSAVILATAGLLLVLATIVAIIVAHALRRRASPQGLRKFAGGRPRARR